MSRLLTEKERSLAGFLLMKNASMGDNFIEMAFFQIKEGVVDELGNPYFLSFKNENCNLIDVGRLPVELIASDGGVPVLIYATVAVRSDGSEVLDTFVLDKMDGTSISAYPDQVGEMMAVCEGRRVGGADLREIYLVD